MSWFEFFGGRRKLVAFSSGFLGCEVRPLGSAFWPALTPQRCLDCLRYTPEGRLPLVPRQQSHDQPAASCEHLRRQANEVVEEGPELHPQQAFLYAPPLLPLRPISLAFQQAQCQLKRVVNLSITHNVFAFLGEFFESKLAFSEQSRISQEGSPRHGSLGNAGSGAVRICRSKA